MSFVNVFCCFLFAQHVVQPCATCWVTLLNMLIHLAQHVVQISIDWLLCLRQNENYRELTKTIEN